MRAVAGQRRAAAKSRRRGGEVRSRTIHLGQERCARGGAGEKTSRMKIQRLAYVLQIFPKLSETFIAGELAELRRRGVEVRILSLLPPRAEVQHHIVHRAGPAELTTYEVGPYRGPRSPTPAGPEAWVVCVARQVKVKNLRLLLDACAELRRRRVAFRCAMIGDGPLHGELKAKRAELGLDNVVAMPGAAEQGEVLQWWRRAAVGVLTSAHEGIPVGLMEAAAGGVPGEATRGAGGAEMVRVGD